MTSTPMNTSLVMNADGELAYMYVGTMLFIPTWVSIDVEKGEICIGGDEDEIAGIKLDKIDTEIYDNIYDLTDILLIGTHDTPERTPRECIRVPLMVSTQIK
ncbi:MAG: hypothetical protein KTR28_07020 [Micavibrio sp.]|nr:hypothetical protein [Micavibrio sp.]